MSPGQLSARKDWDAIAGLTGEGLPEWLLGEAMDPLAEPPEPLSTLPGFPVLHRGASALIVGPTGWGRSMLVQSMAYDAAHAGHSSLYLGHEVTKEEFDARAASLARLRGHRADVELQAVCARVRYVDLTDTVRRAMEEPREWAKVADHFGVVIVDPLSAVASALGLKFSKDGDEYNQFYDALVQPIVGRGCGVVLLDNVGHGPDAQRRAAGSSAKEHRADLTFWCAALRDPPRLLVTAEKARSTRTPWARGDEWVIGRDSQRLERRADDAPPVTGDIADNEARAQAERDELREKLRRYVDEQQPIKSRALVEGFKGCSDETKRELRRELQDAGLIFESPEGWRSESRSGDSSQTQPIRGEVEAPATASESGDESGGVRERSSPRDETRAGHASTHTASSRNGGDPRLFPDSPDSQSAPREQAPDAARIRAHGVQPGGGAS